jgi:hypothetical protein
LQGLEPRELEDIMSVVARFRARAPRRAGLELANLSARLNLGFLGGLRDNLGDALAELDLLALARSRRPAAITLLAADERASGGRADPPPKQPSPRRAAMMLIAALSMSAANAGAASAAESNRSAPPAAVAPASNEALLKKLEAMERRIQQLEGQLKQKAASAPAATPQATAPAAGASPVGHAASSAPAGTTAGGTSAAPSSGAETAESKSILGLVASPVPGLALGAYGEIKFGAFQNPAANGQWQHGFDGHRVVLLPTYQITDNIIFNAEIEFEHGGIAFVSDDKLHGSVDVEQIFVDFKIVDQFNWRAPGIDLVPIGYINQHHEPTQFYSVNRPEIYNGLIPSTFRVPATSVYGRIAEGVRYQLQLSASLEDFGDDFDKRTDANTVPPFPTPYVAGINGIDALGLARPPVGDFRQLSNDMAYAGKLDLAPPFVPGLAASISAYFTPNTTPRGAHDDFGNPLSRSSLTMFDAEFRYRVPNTGLELRGEYARVVFGNPANLRANNDSDPTNNVGKTMWGWSGEAAYHFPLGTILNSEWEAVPFYRYTRENLQTAGFAGADANLPTGAGQIQFHTAGIAIFPSPKMVLKATYQKVIDREPGGAKADSFLGAVGFFF